MKTVIRCKASYPNRGSTLVAYVFNEQLLQVVFEDQQELFEFGMTMFSDVVFVDINIDHLPALQDQLLNCNDGQEQQLARQITEAAKEDVLFRLGKVKITLYAIDGNPDANGYRSDCGHYAINRSIGEHGDRGNWELYIDGMVFDSSGFRFTLATKYNLDLKRHRGD